MLLYRKIFHSSIGRKAVVATTGFFMIVFLFAHMIGNLIVFFGPDPFNAYAAGIQSLGGILWFVRIFMAAVLLLHVTLSILLKRENHAARPIRYVKRGTVRATLTSRTMIYTGGLVFTFLLYHLLHYTFGIVHPEYFGFEDAKGRHDVYRMVVASFRNPEIAIAYLAAVTMLAFHLNHAVASMFQTIGWVRHGVDHFLIRFGAFYSILILFGFSSVPISILAGIIN